MKKYINLNIFKTCLLFSLTYTLLFNTIIFYEEYKNVKRLSLDLSMQVGSDLFITIVLLMTIFLELTINKNTFKIGSLILFICSSIISHQIFKKGPYQSVDSLLSLWTNTNKLKHILSIEFIIYLVFCILMWFYLTNQNKSVINGKPPHVSIIIGFVILLAYLLFFSGLSKLQVYMPGSIINDIF